MRDLIFGLHKDGLRTQRSLILALFCMAFLVGVNGFGQGSSLNPMFAQQQTKWITAPATVSLATSNLGAVAELEIPAGYRFADAADARLLLQRMKNPVTAGLVGLLVPDNGNSYTV